MRIFIIFVWFFASLVTFKGASAADNVQLQLLANRDAAVQGQKITLALVQTIAPEWHTYWKNPGDSGEPMRVTWQNSPNAANVVMGGLLWPAPQRIPYAGLLNYGYNGTATILTDALIPSGITGDTITLTAATTILVCKDICIPEDHQASVTLPIKTSANIANKTVFEQAENLLPRRVDWDVTSTLNADQDKLLVSIKAPQDILKDDGEIALFPERAGLINNAAAQTIVKDADNNTLGITLEVDTTDDLPQTINDLAYVLRIGENAYALPVHALDMADDTATTAESDDVPQESVTTAPEPVDQTPFMVWLGFAVLGGIILNLMPCVFPILSMKALHLTQLSLSERKHAVQSGLFYLLGVVGSFVTIGLVFIGLRDVVVSDDVTIGWGFQLQNPLIVAGLAWLLFLIGLMLFDWFAIKLALPGRLATITDTHAGGAFLTGVLATMVATPCTGPFMAGALGATLTMPTIPALVIFAGLGFGLALPYVVLACVPTLQKCLPRPGGWMIGFRQLLAFPMFASAFWLTWVASQQGGPMVLAAILSGFICVAFAVWLIQHAGMLRRVIAVVMVAILIGLAMQIRNDVLQFPIDDDAAESELVLTNDAWQDFSQNDLQTALDGSDPVFVNMTAAWCITCMVNERVALDIDSTQELFTQNKVIKFKGDWTNRNQEISDYLAEFNRNGVPLYVYYPARMGDGTRPKPQVLPQLLTPATLRSVFESQTD